MFSIPFSLAGQPKWLMQTPGARAQRRTSAFAHTVLRLGLSPVLVLIWLADLPNRIVYSEPEYYGRCRFQEPWAEGTVPVKAANAGPTALRHLKVPMKGDFMTAQEHAADGKIILQRFAESWKDSVMLTLQGMLYYVLQHVLRLFALDHLLFVLHHDIRNHIARLTGAVYTTAEQKQVPLSLLGAMNTNDKHFSIPHRKPQTFPFKQHCQMPELARCHFLCQCARLVYEDAAVIQDVVSRRWHMTFHGHQFVPAHNSRHCWVPDAVYFTCSNDRAFVLSLKGADPMWQLGLAADPPTSKSTRAGIGQVHNGLWQGLHQSNPFFPGESMYDTLVKQLKQAHADGKEIYLTGHSLGGSLTSVLATVLLEREPALAASIKGIVTFAAPRAGDPTFAARYNAAFGDCTARFVHGADMVVMLPPRGLGFKHVGRLHHLASHPVSWSGSRLLVADEDHPAVRHEDRWGYWNSLRKLAASPFKGENALRLLTRLLMLPVPGFSDHLPSDYELALRRELRLLQG